MIDNFGLRLCLIDLVDNNNDRGIAILELGQKLLFKTPPPTRLGYNDSKVCSLKHLKSLLDPQSAEGPLVVDAGSIDKQHRPEGEKLHRLLDWIRGGTGELRNNGNVLASYSVEKTRFAAVTAPEYPDMESKALGCTLIRRFFSPLSFQIGWTLSINGSDASIIS